MVQRAQLVEDTMAKVEGMRGKDNSKPVFVKKGARNMAPTFRNNNVNNNNKRPNVRRDVTGDKRVKVEGRKLVENCKFYDKPGHRAEECWKKLGACLRCGGCDHSILDCPMMKDQPGKAPNVPRRQGRLNAVLEADLPEEGGMGQTFSCKGSVDTTINGVDTMAQSKGRNVKKRSTSVDTSPGQISQKSHNFFPHSNLKCSSGQVDTTPSSVDTPFTQVDTHLL
ncbi:hypothetical protein Taro_027628 [Colocasia esculenta]|uniref:Uncharacterized protein n=1 Tax=Colocasia esculenta TaxID=4460 RepID=A0A843VG79_COLES|nr:hypothetical protein [Colocasia esculenta]